jgi:hypothetical protein
MGQDITHVMSLWCREHFLSHCVFLLIRYIIIMRTKEIRLSDSEHSRLQNYKTNKYHSTVPFGYVISELLDEAQEEE